MTYESMIMNYGDVSLAVNQPTNRERLTEVFKNVVAFEASTNFSNI